MSETDDRTGRTGKGGGRRLGAAIGLVGVGLAAGAVLASTLTANAAPGTTAAPSASASAAPDQDNDRGPRGGGTRDESKPQRSDETLLTGDAKAKVTAAALAKVPGGKILRVETDSDGVYEAHMTDAAGQRITVKVGKDFTVTGTDSH